ncbi:4'-phosphopantetheinyl transferase [Streptomyces sp. ZG43]
MSVLRSSGSGVPCVQHPGSWPVRDLPRADLYPQEARIVERAVALRKREFATTRRCAREALATLGLLPCRFSRTGTGPRGGPRGAGQSHALCRYRAAVVAQAADLRLLGIDAEPDAPLPRGVLEPITFPSELCLVRHLTVRRPQVRWDRALFSRRSTKLVSVYRSPSGLPGRPTRLRRGQPRPHRTAAHSSGPRLEGRLLADKGLLVTAIAG